MLYFQMDVITRDRFDEPEKVVGSLSSYLRVLMVETFAKDGMQDKQRFV
jgi:hypothetical protein